MRKKLVFTLGVMYLVISACASVKDLNEFFIISYLPPTSHPRVNAMPRKPLPYRVGVRDFEISRIYDRDEIVTRVSAHQMFFESTRKWALRPGVTVTELMISHMNAIDLFNECKREFLDYKPDYTISGRINNIEQYRADKFAFAYVNIDLYFRDRNGDTIIHHHVRDRVELEVARTAFFVKMISDILMEQTDVFIGKIVDHFEKK